MTSMWEKSMTAWRSRLFAFAVMAGAVVPAWSQGAIQNITSSQQAGAEVIRVELSEPLAAVPAGFTVQAPPRIALDLPGFGASAKPPDHPYSIHGAADAVEATWRHLGVTSTVVVAATLQPIKASSRSCRAANAACDAKR